MWKGFFTKKKNLTVNWMCGGEKCDSTGPNEALSWEVGKV